MWFAPRRIEVYFVGRLWTKSGASNTYHVSLMGALIPFPHPSRGPDWAKVALEPAEEAEMLLVRSIEWTVVEAETSDTAWNCKVDLTCTLGIDCFSTSTPYLRLP